MSNRITINNTTYTDCRWNVPEFGLNPTPDLPLKTMLYCECEDTDFNYRIYNKYNLEKYIYREIDIGQNQEVQWDESYAIKKDKVTDMEREVTEKELFNGLYYNKRINDIAFLPDLHDQDDQYIVYRYEKKYKFMCLEDLMSPETRLQSMLKTKIEYKLSTIVNRIVKTLADFHATEKEQFPDYYSRAKAIGTTQPAGICIWGLEVPPTDVSKGFVVTRDLASWRYINIHRINLYTEMEAQESVLRTNPTVDTNINSRLDLSRVLESAIFRAGII